MPVLYAQADFLERPRRPTTTWRVPDDRHKSLTAHATSFAVNLLPSTECRERHRRAPSASSHEYRGTTLSVARGCRRRTRESSGRCEKFDDETRLDRPAEVGSSAADSTYQTAIMRVFVH